ncbi:MAG: class I SAM-dependent methyltransferase, partial [Chitinophagales bacterium]|nr:class I SAM-dependent methyltransferase [Chitinophagales bacterium]
LEIGVRNPNDNYNKIMADVKYSVDPGVEFKENPVDFKMTSDAFFERLRNGEHIDRNIRFELIFIDGLHLADQVDRDIEHALAFLKDDGFLVMHDCNPPTEWHAKKNSWV